MQSEDWTQPREVISDDADIDRVGGYRLSIFMGGNGDWYVSILEPGDRLGPCVRLRTSGGAASDHPGLCVAIANAYRALGPRYTRESCAACASIREAGDAPQDQPHTCVADVRASEETDQ